VSGLAAFFAIGVVPISMAMLVAEKHGALPAVLVAYGAGGLIAWAMTITVEHTPDGG
jgi:hypothetical protein